MNYIIDNKKKSKIKMSYCMQYIIHCAIFVTNRGVVAISNILRG